MASLRGIMRGHHSAHMYVHTVLVGDIACACVIYIMDTLQLLFVSAEVPPIQLYLLHHYQRYFSYYGVQSHIK